MKFTVQNLGRLAEATIDLDKDLILFVGPNNTSKTYVAHTLYGFFTRASGLFASLLDDTLQKPADDATSWAIDILSLFDSRIIEEFTNIGQRYRAELADVLAATEDFTAATAISLALNPSPITTIESLPGGGATVQEFSITPTFHARLAKSPGESVFQFSIIPTADTTALPGKSDIIVFRRFVTWFLGGLLAATTLNLGRFTYLLPAERAAIQLFSRELSINRTHLIDEMLKFAGRGRKGMDNRVMEVLRHSARRYPAGIRAYLELANDLSNQRKLASPFAPLADHLDEIIGGTLHVTDDGDLRFQPGAESPTLDLHLASSSVKALAGLSFHLRHLLTENDTLIIDEPELNLHPDNQRRVARVLARLVRGGVKVILTTHSDYIVREFNNLIMLSADAVGELRERHGYLAEETLKPSQVGAYRFDATRAHPLEVTPTGIEVESIDREINALNTASQDIYFSLFNKA